MPESEHHVTVTAEERVHPAVRKLARACIALARFQLGRQPAPGEKSGAAGAAVSPSTAPPETEVTP